MAEWCGFKKWKSKSGKVYLRRVSESPSDYLRDCKDGLTEDPITQPLFGVPDFEKDLNAMHEAESLLSESQATDYADYLLHYADCCSGFSQQGDTESNNPPWLFNVAHATAPQRVEALLRTTGKWKDESCK